jgi:hypothetical protein
LEVGFSLEDFSDDLVSLDLRFSDFSDFSGFNEALSPSRSNCIGDPFEAA